MKTFLKFSGTNNGNISYIYNAIGGKVKKVVEDNVANTTTDYLTGFQYKNTELQFFPHAEGYVHYTKPLTAQGGANSALGSFNYVFNYTDHLGNVRVSYAKDPLVGNRVKILEENHYYAFGLKHKNYNVERLDFDQFPDTGVELVPMPAVANASYNYKYNGKELQEELGLNVYDLGFRNYMPDIGRFAVIDPMTDFVNYQSPYVFSNNSPIVNIDADGLGIFNVIGNLFKRLVGAIGSIGNDCSCNKYTQESVRGAWNRADFPKINEAINKLFTKKTTNYTRPAGEFSGVRAKPLNLSGIKIDDIGFDIPEIRLPNGYARIDGEIIKPTQEFSFNKTIQFNGNSDIFSDEEASDKILNDLVKTLVDYPQIQVEILSNTSSDKYDPNKNLKTPGTLNHTPSTIGGIQLARGKAIKNFLINKGIDPKRLKVGYGEIKSEGPSGRTTSFKIKN